MVEVKKFPVVVILENVRSAHNVGAIFRTCDGAGISKLYLVGITPYPPHNKIPKTALGAEDFVEWEKIDKSEDLINKLKSEGFKIYAIEQAENSVNYSKITYPEKTALLFGNEITGILPETLKLCDKVIEIPMFGQKNSLNVATTVGIICYHTVNHIDETN